MRHNTCLCEALWGLRFAARLLLALFPEHELRSAAAQAAVVQRKVLEMACGDAFLFVALGPILEA